MDKRHMQESLLRNRDLFPSMFQYIKFFTLIKYCCKVAAI